MKKYRSLIFRELKTAQRHLIETTALLLLFIAMILFTVFAQSGSSSNTPPEAVKGIAFFLCSALSILMAVIICLDNAVVESDIRTGWSRYSLTLPITSWEKAVTGYMIRTAMVAAGTAICLLCTLIIDHRLDSSISGCTMNIYFAVLGLGFLCNAVYGTFLFHAGKEKAKRFKILLAVIAVCAILCTLKFFPIKAFAAVLEEADMHAMIAFFHIPERFSPISVLLLVPAIAVSFFITWKNAERRDD